MDYKQNAIERFKKDLYATETTGIIIEDVYPGYAKCCLVVDSDNSYIRTRGFTLIAYNAKWDIDYKTDEIIDKYLCFCR